MGFNLVHLAITLQTNDAARLSRTLPLLGNEYAAACRVLSCRWPQRVCETCSARETCGWYLVFGQKLSSDPAALKRHQKPPLPIMFTFPVTERFPEKITEIVCDLVVIGTALSQLDLLLNGFDELLSGLSAPLSAEIKQIACRDYQGLVACSSRDNGKRRPGSIVPENLIVMSTAGLLESRSWIGSTLHIRLLTPLRLLVDSRRAVRFEFSTFARSVVRRVSSLAYYYGEREFVCDFKELSRQIEQVTCRADHYSYLAAHDKILSGISGYGSFCGDFSSLMPFLVIGSYVHTGKGSSFGLGAYEVALEEDGG